METRSTQTKGLVMSLSRLCSGWVVYSVLALTLWVVCKAEGGSTSVTLMALIQPMATTGNQLALHLWQWGYIGFTLLLVPAHLGLAYRGTVLMKPMGLGGATVISLTLAMMWSVVIFMHQVSPSSSIDTLLMSPFACAGVLSFQALITARWLAHLLMRPLQPFLTEAL